MKSTQSLMFEKFSGLVCVAIDKVIVAAVREGDYRDIVLRLLTEIDIFRIDGPKPSYPQISIRLGSDFITVFYPFLIGHGITEKFLT